MEDFVGVKVALYFGNKLVVFLRDDKPGLRFANMWDFPGGGREGAESPVECAQREIEEEFGIKVASLAFTWTKEYPAMHEPNRRAYFMVAHLSREQFDAIQFGDEGQRWQLMTPEEFLLREDIVPYLRGRLGDYLEQGKG